MRVWVNGSFDVMHIGHIELLKMASKYGKLRVGLDSDRRIRELKGTGRPFNTLQDRYEFMTSIKYVDSIVTFDTIEDLENEMKIWNPDLMVIGSDYIGRPIVGAHIATSIMFFNRVKDLSSSKILGYENSNNR